MLKLRMLTAFGLLPIALAILFLLPELWFAISVGLILLVGAWEWTRLSGLRQSSGTILALVIVFSGLLIFSYKLNHSYVPIVLIVGCFFWVSVSILVLKYPSTKNQVSGVLKKLGMGILVLVPTFIGLLLLRRHDAHELLVALLVAIIWAADIGAYFVGRQFGRMKLMPHVSPEKSWAGVFGGMFMALCGGGLIAYAFESDTEIIATNVWLWLIPVVCITVLFSVMGDLFESLIKRESGVKDSSALLPGHGGVLDRIDSLTAATPIFALSIYLIDRFNP